MHHNSRKVKLPTTDMQSKQSESDTKHKTATLSFTPVPDEGTLGQGIFLNSFKSTHFLACLATGLCHNLNLVLNAHFKYSHSQRKKNLTVELWTDVSSHSLILTAANYQGRCGVHVPIMRPCSSRVKSTVVDVFMYKTGNETGDLCVKGINHLCKVGHCIDI